MWMTGNGAPMERNQFGRVGAEVVLEAALPTFADIEYGYAKGFLSRADVVALSSHRMQVGVPLSVSEEQVALLLSDEYSQLDELLSPPSYEGMADPTAGSAIADSRRFWAYVRTRAVRLGAGDGVEIWSQIEDAFEDLDLAPELEGLIRWLPARADQELGLEAMKSRLVDYLRSEDRFFERRNLSMLNGQR